MLEALQLPPEYRRLLTENDREATIQAVSWTALLQSPGAVWHYACLVSAGACRISVGICFSPLTASVKHDAASTGTHGDGQHEAHGQHRQALPLPLHHHCRHPTHRLVPASRQAHARRSCIIEPPPSKLFDYTKQAFDDAQSYLGVRIRSGFGCREGKGISRAAAAKGKPHPVQRALLRALELSRAARVCELAATGQHNPHSRQ